MDYDLIIIGAGWAGFTAAIKAKESGKRVALVEQDLIGGTCLNRGCIPTKALIQSAKVFSLIKKSKLFGIEAQVPTVNFAEVRARKDKLIQQLRQGMLFRLKGVDVLTGPAKLISSDTVSVAGKNITTGAILIATGSKPAQLKDLRFDGQKIISSDDMLNLESIPKSLLIIGGGVIGCEFAGLFYVLGAQVTIIEKLPQLLPGVDKDLARKLELSYKKKGIKVNTGADALSVDFNSFDKVLLCIGRVPGTGDLGLEGLGVELERGRIKVDECLRTNIPNIYAAGDCTGKVMLAHYAAYQGEIAVHNIFNPDSPKKAVNQAVPGCIFTDPEIATVGIDETAALDKGLKTKIHRFDFLASGMARIQEETEGFIKIISDENSGVVLGGSIMGPKATELIAVLTVAVTNSLTVTNLKETIFAHPTLSESIHEALQ